MDYKKVRRLFYYEEGHLYWKVDRPRGAKVNDRAGTVNSKGYVTIFVDGSNYLAHRLIWLWHYSYFPENEIDHIDRDPGNNRIENLREVSRQCNSRNVGISCRNSTDVIGVSPHNQSGKFQAKIGVNYKAHTIIIDEDFDECVLARLTAERCLNWPGCNSFSTAYQYARKHKLIQK